MADRPTHIQQTDAREIAASQESDVEETRESLKRRSATLERENKRQLETLERENKRLKGTLFSRIEDVIKPVTSSYKDQKCFEDLHRDRFPTFMERRKPPASDANPNAYTLTSKNAEGPNEVEMGSTTAATSSVKSHDQPSSKKVIWPVDIFGRADSSGDIAHLLPNSSNNASLYFDVIRWIYGLPKNVETDMLILQKLIHGTKGAVRRSDHTGTRHFVCNKLRLVTQMQHFDTNPRLLILPVMDLETAKTWNGEEYQAIVIAATKWDGVEAAQVYTQIGLTYTSAVYAEAKKNHIEEACELLAHICRGLAYSLNIRMENKLKDEYFDKTVRDALMKIVSDLLQKFNPATSPLDVIVPSVNPNLPEDLHVAMVTFVDHSNNGEHPAPDPLLLAVKSAINWSWLHNQKLLVGGEPPPEDEDSIAAEEQYLEWREQQLRPTTWEDLAIGLHQPHGYQEDSTVP